MHNIPIRVLAAIALFAMVSGCIPVRRYELPVRTNANLNTNTAIQATSSEDEAADDQQLINANGTLTIEAKKSLNGSVGTPLTAQFSATGAAPPYTWSVNKGTLPPGMVLEEESLPGVPCLQGTPCPKVEPPNYIYFTGVPKVAGTYSFEITVRDKKGNTGSKSFTSVIESSSNYGCRLPCIGAAPDENFGTDCTLFTTKDRCESYTDQKFPYRCAWINMSVGCPLYP